MLPDFTLITHKFADRPDIEIWPVFDLHIGSPEYNAAEWDKFSKMILSRENAYIVLGGDLVDNSIKNSIGNSYQATMPPSAQKALIVKMLEPLKDRILCSVGGNHERRSQRETDSNIGYDIMCKLDIEHLYRESAAYVRIKMGVEGGAGQQNPTYMICVSHGAAGGSKYGGVVNKAVDYGYAIDGCDVLVVGHSHKPFVAPPAKIVIDGQHGRAYIRPFYVVNATAWLNYGGYASQKMLLPSAIAPGSSFS